jgi:hypothetical protein
MRAGERGSEGLKDKEVWLHLLPISRFHFFNNSLTSFKSSHASRFFSATRSR